MAGQADFRFFGRLATLLAGVAGEAAITYRFCGSPAVKDSIEALGLPHTEVELILVAGRSVGSDYRLQPGDQVEVFPFGSAATPNGRRPLCRTPRRIGRSIDRQTSLLGLTNLKSLHLYYIAIWRQLHPPHTGRFADSRPQRASKAHPV